MINAPQVPGVRFKVQPRLAGPSPLRSDVAGLIGQTARGPVGEAVRVEGYREFVNEFGPLLAVLPFTYSVRGYFENGGQVAYVVRIGAGNSEPAKVKWNTSATSSDGKTLQQLQGFRFGKYRIEASSPGRWGRGLRVSISYELLGQERRPSVSITVRAPGEPTEQIRNLLPDVTPEDEKRSGRVKTMESRVEDESNLIRLTPVLSSKIEAPKKSTDPAVPGPRHYRWQPDELLFEPDLESKKLKSNGASTSARVELQRELRREYLNAIEALGDRPEVAIVALLGLYDDIKSESGRIEIIGAAVKEAAELQDRMVLIDVPPDPDALGQPVSPVGFAAQLRRELPSEVQQRAAAIYHPRLLVSDPLGGNREPFRHVAASGHLAGVISRVDREQGAAQTPANVPVLDAVDIEESLAGDAGELVEGQGIVSFNEAGVNLVRCRPNRGLLVWGGRTLDRRAEGKFVSHRRFIHRLVRAIRRAADPIVFDINGPEAWLVLIRAVSTVLLEAFRGGALRGERPDEAFFVQCDDQSNPYPQREQGRLVCNIGLALAAPMEFITLRIALSESGHVEVFDQ